MPTKQAFGQLGICETLSQKQKQMIVYPKSIDAIDCNGSLNTNFVSLKKILMFTVVILSVCFYMCS